MPNIYDYDNDADLVGEDLFEKDDLGEEMEGTRFWPAEEKGEAHVIEYIDYLDFARDRGDLDGLTDEDGWLTPEALEAAAAPLKKILVERWNLDQEFLDTHLYTETGGSDDPHIVVALAYPAGTGTVADMMENYATPFFAAVQNITDPGTFNHPYLWGEVKDLLNS